MTVGQGDSEANSYPYYPDASIYNHMAQLSNELWMFEMKSGVESTIADICEDRGLFVEYMVAGLHTASTHRLMIQAHAESTVDQNITQFFAGNLCVALRLFNDQLRLDPHLISSQAYRERLLESFTPSSFEITFAIELADSGTPGKRSALMRCIVYYLAYLLQGMMTLDSQFQGYVATASDAAKVYHRMRFASTTAALCAKEIISLAPRTGEEAGFTRMAQIGFTRAGLLISERPEAWKHLGEDLLRDVSVPFLVSAGLNAEAEARVFSGKSDIQFRRGDVSGPVFQRGVAEFKIWRGLASFNDAWNQVTLEHSTGHENYLAIVVLYRKNNVSELVQEIAEHLSKDSAVSAVAPRYKGSGTLAGLDGRTSVRGSTAIPFGVFIYELGYENPRKNASPAPAVPVISGRGRADGQ